MAASLQQQMAAAGQMMPQQQQMRQRPTPNQVSNYVFQNLMQQTEVPQGWQGQVQLNERMGKITNLYVFPASSFKVSLFRGMTADKSQGNLNDARSPKHGSLEGCSIVHRL